MIIQLGLPGSGRWSGIPVSAEDAVRGILQSCAAAVGVPSEAISRIVLAAASEYGAAIRSIAPGEKSTNNASATGMAKTISIADSTGRRSVVIMWAELFADVPGIPVAPGSVSERDRELMRHYIACHELGHCKDNWLRGAAECPPLSVSGEFKIQSVAAYYHYILLSEFAACAHSSNALDADTLTWERDHTDIIPNVLMTIREKRRTYAEEVNGLSDLAFMASGAFWTMLIQFGKLVGSRLAHPELRTQVPEAWLTNGRIAEDLFVREGRILEERWRSYPAWDDETPSELFELWRLLVENQGYCFEETANGDSLSLR